MTWLALYPTITLAILVADKVGITRLWLPVRTLILTVVLVPLMVFVLVPAINRCVERLRGRRRRRACRSPDVNHSF